METPDGEVSVDTYGWLNIHFSDPSITIIVHYYRIKEELCVSFESVEDGRCRILMVPFSLLVIRSSQKEGVYVFFQNALRYVSGTLNLEGALLIC